MPNYYNPYFYGYQQQGQMQNPQMNAPQIPQNIPQMPQQIQNGGFLSAPNEEFARNYPVGLGNSVTFKDENAPYVYTKTMGFSQLESPTFDKYRLVKEEPKSANNKSEEEPTNKISYEELKGEIEAVKGEIKDIWNYDVEDFSNVHYTCQNGTTSCESIAFITKVNVTTALVSSSYDYYLMTDGKGMQDVLRESLYDDEVNKQDSIVKRVVDLWYQRYLSTYDSYLEDVIYCGDRYISDFKSYSDTGALSSIGLSFDASKNNYDGLDCKLETDQFSVSNPKAHLNYPIGLSTYPEMVLLNSNTLRAAGYTFWTMTPDRFQDSATEGVVEVRGGFNATSHTNSLEYVRPVIALKAGIKYTDGEGSEENPYIVG